MSKEIFLFSINSHLDSIHINPLDITFFKPEINFSKYDYLIITSKQASKALLQYEKSSYVNKKALCVSTQSAKSYEELGGEILEIGRGYGDTLESIIKKYPKETKWLYLRAKIVASDFAKKLQEEGYCIDEAIVYESSCSQEIAKKREFTNSIAIFTSPSSVECFMKFHDINLFSHVIVIGKTTAKKIPKTIECIVAPNTTITSCIEIAKKIQNSISIT